MTAAKEDIRTVYTQLCDSYRAIDDFRSKLLGFLPLATGGLFFFITNPGGLIGKAVKAGAESETSILPTDIMQAIGWFGVVITLGLYCYELYGIRKCTNLIFLGMALEIELGEIKGQFLMRPDGVLQDYISNRFGKKFDFISINEPFAAGIIYPAVIAAWTFIAFSRTGSIKVWAAAIMFTTVFLLSMCFMHWLVKTEIPILKKVINLEEKLNKLTDERKKAREDIQKQASE